jgi:PKD repeat protein
VGGEKGLPNATRRLGLVLAVSGFAAVGGPGCRKETVTTPTLAAQCTANPSSGEAPLTVAFSLNVAGAQGAFTVSISYGDGTQGTDPDRPHVYASAGAYSASFTVATASQSARCSAAISVAAPPSPSPLPNQPPEPFYKINPAPSGSTITGTAPLEVNFNLCRTVDPDGDALYYEMDLDGDRAFEFHGATGADCRHGVTYAAGTRQATLCVTDLDCPLWPACEGLPPLHPFQCRTYSVVAAP